MSLLQNDAETEVAPAIGYRVAADTSRGAQTLRAKKGS